jgi:hypothetical protein
MPSLSEILRESPADEHEYFRSQGGELAEPGPETEPHEPDDAEPAGEPDAGDDLKPERVKPDDAEPAEAEPEPAEAERKNVPLAVLREEREKRQEIQNKLEETRRTMAQMEGRFQQLVQGLQQQGQQQQPQPQAPTPDEDPIGLLRQMAAEREQTRQASAQQQAKAQFEQHVGALEAQYMQANPDYREAAEFLQTRRLADLEAMGIADPHRRHAALYEETVGLAANAIASGKNPAEVAFNLARTWGFQPKAQRQEQTVGAAEQKIEAAQRGQAASRSLSSGGGSSPQGLTLEAVANLSDEEFSKLSDAKWAKLWGG